MSYLDQCTDAQVVKAYTRLMMISEPAMSILMAQVPLDKATTASKMLGTDLTCIATAIIEWCLRDVKPLEATIYPATLEENLENELTITDVLDTDTAEGLVTAFHKAIKWNTPAK